MTSNRASPLQRSRNLTPSVPAITTNTSPKPSFKKRFWTISSSNNFTQIPTPDPLSTSPEPRAPSPAKNKPYVPRHAASDFSRNAQAGTLRLRHRHSVAVMSTHAKPDEDDATLCNYPVDRRNSSDTKRASVFLQDNRRSSMNFHETRRTSVNVHETKRNSVFFNDVRRSSAVVHEPKRNSVAMPTKRPSVTFQSSKRASVVFPHHQQSKRGSVMIQLPMQRSSRHFALPSENNDDYSQFIAQAERKAEMQKKRASQHVSVSVLAVPASPPKERRRSSVFVQRIAQYVRPSR